VHGRTRRPRQRGCNCWLVGDVRRFDRGSARGSRVRADELINSVSGRTYRCAESHDPKPAATRLFGGRCGASGFSERLLRCGYHYSMARNILGFAAPAGMADMAKRIGSCAADQLDRVGFPGVALWIGYCAVIAALPMFADFAPRLLCYSAEDFPGGPGRVVRMSDFGQGGTRYLKLSARI